MPIDLDGSYVPIGMLYELDAQAKQFDAQVWLPAASSAYQTSALQALRIPGAAIAWPYSE